MTKLKKKKFKKNKNYVRNKFISIFINLFIYLFIFIYIYILYIFSISIFNINCFIIKLLKLLTIIKTNFFLKIKFYNQGKYFTFLKFLFIIL